MSQNEISLQGTKEADFAASRRGCFFQKAPLPRNQFNADVFLQSYLRRILSSEVSTCDEGPFVPLDLPGFIKLSLCTIHLTFQDYFTHS